jgi:putative transposase
MPRQGRIVVKNSPHHVVQRGVRRERTFFSPEDYRIYLRIAASAFKDARVEVWAYCLMPNHVHLIATPSTANGLAEAVGATHARYTRVINERQRWNGSLWQGRFASFAMDERYFLACTRYVGLNPVRAGLCRRAIDWPWSSVRSHVLGFENTLLTPTALLERIGREVRDFFDCDVDDATRHQLRRAAVAGGPLLWKAAEGTGTRTTAKDRVT